MGGEESDHCSFAGCELAIHPGLNCSLGNVEGEVEEGWGVAFADQLLEEGFDKEAGGVVEGGGDRGIIDSIEVALFFAVLAGIEDVEVLDGRGERGVDPPHFGSGDDELRI